LPSIRNPVSRILSLALLTVLVNHQGWLEIGFILLPLLYLFAKFPAAGRKILLLATRLRWFYLSIAVLFLWFYPGTDLVPQLGVLSPTREGALQAALRITGLFVIIAYSGFLVMLTSRDGLISGIQGLLSPFRYLGLDTSRVSLRMGLVLDILPQISLDKQLKSDSPSLPVIDRVAHLVSAADNTEFSTNMGAIFTFEKLPAPGLPDFVVPVILLSWLILTI
jgi:energy-coupling factor transporter transmembrane protein EcfT